MIHGYFFILLNHAYCILKACHPFSISVKFKITFFIPFFNWFEQFCLYIFFCLCRILIRIKVSSLESTILVYVFWSVIKVQQFMNYDKIHKNKQKVAAGDKSKTNKKSPSSESFSFVQISFRLLLINFLVPKNVLNILSNVYIQILLLLSWSVLFFCF